MLEVKYSTRFKKDLKVCQKRHYNMALLQQVVNVLAVPEQLPPQNRDHSLTGSYIPHRCESIVEIFIRNNQTSKGKSGKDMKKQPLQRTNM